MTKTAERITKLVYHYSARDNNSNNNNSTLHEMHNIPRTKETDLNSLHEMHNIWNKLVWIP